MFLLEEENLSALSPGLDCHYLKGQLKAQVPSKGTNGSCLVLASCDLVEIHLDLVLTFPSAGFTGAFH